METFEEYYNSLEVGDIVTYKGKDYTIKSFDTETSGDYISMYPTWINYVDEEHKEEEMIKVEVGDFKAYVMEGKADDKANE